VRATDAAPDAPRIQAPPGGGQEEAMKASLVRAAVLLLAAPLAQAADAEAGKARAQAVCAACHGAPP